MALSNTNTNVPVDAILDDVVIYVESHDPNSNWKMVFGTYGKHGPGGYTIGDIMYGYTAVLSRYVESDKDVEFKGVFERDSTAMKNGIPKLTDEPAEDAREVLLTKDKIREGPPDIGDSYVVSSWARVCDLLPGASLVGPTSRGNYWPTVNLTAAYVSQELAAKYDDEALAKHKSSFIDHNEVKSTSKWMLLDTTPEPSDDGWLDDMCAELDTMIAVCRELDDDDRNMDAIYAELDAVADPARLDDEAEEFALEAELADDDRNMDTIFAELDAVADPARLDDEAEEFALEAELADDDRNMDAIFAELDAVADPARLDDEAEEFALEAELAAAKHVTHPHEMAYDAYLWELRRPKSPSDPFSLFIPRVFPNITKERIIAIFRALDFPVIERIDFLLKNGTNKKTGAPQPYNCVYVHFYGASGNHKRVIDDIWKLIRGETLKIMYDEPWYWLVSLSTAEKPPADPHVAPRPNIPNYIRTLCCSKKGLLNMKPRPPLVCHA
jgi:hypothetical protein